MRKLILLSGFLFISNLLFLPARAECTDKTCIDVYVKDGQIVIEGKKNGATSSPKPKVATTSTSKPKPKPKITVGKSPSIKKYSYKPRSKTHSSKPSAASTSPSLADKILQSLPTLQVAYQPAGSVLPRVPVIFFTDLPTFFNKTYKVVGVPVKINVKPKSVWEFGDGSILVTNKAGKPYPSHEISHSYSAPGTYPVVVATIWDGTYTINGVTRPINGVIRQVSGVDVKVVGANTKFVGK